jgi:sigma-B regulation protein RsbU (phosphoserine phosphatase)
MAYRDYPYAFDRRELDLVLSLSMQGVVALENARFFKQALESQRLEQELTLAKSIQQRLLPNRMPDLRGVEIAAINIPCYAVGGDYYDILSFEDNTLSVAIADVAGKGIPASLLMANLQASFRLLAGERASCDSLVTRLNSVIFENMTRDKFISFFYCTVNPEESRLEYCNAGHNYPMLFRKNGAVEHLKTGGLVLGALPDFSYQRATVAFEPGDVCVLFTDGVSEAMNQLEDEYSEINLQKVVQHHRENSASALADTILQSVKSHMNGKEQQDDITLIVLRRTGAV